jgi:hypothetical protein
MQRRTLRRVDKGEIMKRIGVVLLGMFSLISIFQGIGFSADDNNAPECAVTNLNFIGARKQLSSDWKPADQQDELGASVDIQGKGWPISLDFSYLYATQKGKADEIIRNQSFSQLEREAVTEEVGLGLRKNWSDEHGFTVFLGGGAAWVKGSLTFTNVDTFSESKVGWYGTTGFYVTFAHFLNIGVIGRYSDVPLTINNVDLNAGGWHYGAFAGFHF